MEPSGQGSYLDSSCVKLRGQSPVLQTSPKPLSHALDLAGVAVVKTDQELSCCSAEKGQPLPVLVAVW